MHTNIPLKYTPHMDTTTHVFEHVSYKQKLGFD